MNSLLIHAAFSITNILQSFPLNNFTHFAQTVWQGWWVLYNAVKPIKLQSVLSCTFERLYVFFFEIARLQLHNIFLKFTIIYLMNNNKIIFFLPPNFSFPVTDDVLHNCRTHHYFLGKSIIKYNDHCWKVIQNIFFVTATRFDRKWN